MASALTDLGDASRTTERKWRRRCLRALPVLLPLAAFALGYEHLYWLWHGNTILSRNVRAGETASFGGSEWRLASMASRSDIKPERIPPGFALVIVDLAARVGSARNILKVGDTTFEQLWGACKVGLLDPQGRRWQAISLGYAPELYPAGGTIDTCGSHSQAMPPPETVVSIRETFVVPQDVVRTVRPTLSLDGEQPYFLLFERPQKAN
ncbi:hypothetical protein [Rhizobium binxianense]